MIRTGILAAVAALLLSACVTPLAANLQNPQPAYVAQGKTLVAVVDLRDPAVKYRKPNVLGVYRNMGLANDFQTKMLMAQFPKTEQAKTVAQLLSDRVVGGLTSAGWSAAPVEMSKAPGEPEAKALVEGAAGDQLLTLGFRDWQVDVNISWVGRFRFYTETDVTVHDRTGALKLKKTFKDDEAIQAEGADNWQNQILAAWKAQLDEILADPEVRGALGGG